MFRRDAELLLDFRGPELLVGGLGAAELEELDSLRDELAEVLVAGNDADVEELSDSDPDTRKLLAGNWLSGENMQVRAVLQQYQH